MEIATNRKVVIFMSGQETSKETTYNNATVRVHFPDGAKDERMERIKRATEIFLKKAMMQKRGNNNG